MAGTAGTVYVAFDPEDARYAAALARSVLDLNPGWTVRAFATNVLPADLACYPWTDRRVIVHRESVLFDSDEARRVYMACGRFARFCEWLPIDGFALMLDADMVCTGDLGQLRPGMETRGEDIAIIRRPLLERRRQVRACTIACRWTPATRVLWDAYAATLPAHPAWYADQIALVEAIECAGPSLLTLDLPEAEWCSFLGGPKVKLLATGGAYKAASSPEWHRQYLRRYGECIDQADGPRGDPRQVALVWVIFGQDAARHRACLAGMEATLRTDRPGRILLLEALEPHEGPDCFGDWCEIRNIERHVYPTGPRHRGVWQKENLWQIALAILAGDGHTRWAVYLDADCEPMCSDWAARVAEMHDAGARVFQPWHLTQDTGEADIGGVSCSWTLSRRNGTVDHPGFCWSVDIAYLSADCGFSCIEPLGGGDTILAQWYLGNRSGLSTWADHMAWAKAGARRRVTPAALDIELRHHTHGPRANRLYTARYPIAAMASGGNIMSLYVHDGQGLLRVADGPTGDAWLRMLARRSEWAELDMDHNRALWAECQAEASR